MTGVHTHGDGFLSKNPGQGPGEQHFLSIINVTLDALAGGSLKQKAIKSEM